MIDRKYPIPSDPRFKGILEQIYGAIDDLQKQIATRPSLSPAEIASISQKAANQAAGLLGAFAQPVLGQNVSDPALQGVPTGNGTVTSVALAVPAQLGISGSPITSTGTITISWANQTANTILAGPGSGPARQRLGQWSRRIYPRRRLKVLRRKQRPERLIRTMAMLMQP
jgi:hypothetical protein